MQHQDQPALRVDELRMIYGTGEGAVTALDDVSLRFERGSFTAR